MQIQQVTGIVYYEFRMLWRERALVVITFSLLLMVLIPSLIASESYFNASESAFQVMADAQLQITQVIRMMLWGPVAASIAILAPIFVADIIPKDQQLGVRELLDAAPLPRATYLAGKLIGGWLALFSSLLIVMLAAGLLWYLRIGGLDWPTYLEMWLVGASALVIINGGLGIILPAPLSTRRRAILGMIGVLTLSFFLGNQAVGEDIWSLVRGPVITYYLSENLAVARSGFLQSVAIGAAQLVLLSLVMWGWMRWRDSKR